MRVKSQIHRPKKRLGQNFLKDKNILKKMVNACGLTAEDVILEIGAGKGDLTTEILTVSKKVFALELDRHLVLMLEERLNGIDNCSIINADILKFDINRLLRDKKVAQKIKVVGNIPYYISSPIIEHLIRYRDCISEIFLTVQKEFGRRVAASPGSKDYGSFSCFVQYYLKPGIIFEIKKNSFYPVPKVDSSFLSLKVRGKPPVKVRDEALLFKIIRAAFCHRRKTLRNSLEGVVEQGQLEEFFSAHGIDRNARPEELSLEQFADLANF